MSEPSRNKILVTGANGQLGMELRDLSAAYPQYEFIFLSREQLAIENEKAVNSVFNAYKPKYCINCAAYTAVDKAEAETELAFLINAKAVGIIASACRENNTRLIHISTDYVFNGRATTPYKADDPVEPVNTYGASKLEGERLAILNNPGSIIIRTSWVYSSYGKNFVRTMLRLMKEKKEISVVNDQFGSPTYAADLAETILTIINGHSRLTADHSPFRIFHYSNEGIITWYEFALAIKELAPADCLIHPITTAEYPTPAKRPAYSALDKTGIKEVFKIALKDWRASLKACVQRIEGQPGR
jgi:dTDP-4-dehydrorhamnose reductase